MNDFHNTFAESYEKVFNLGYSDEELSQCHVLSHLKYFIFYCIQLMNLNILACSLFGL
jgi:hypothetical protein